MLDGPDANSISTTTLFVGPNNNTDDGKTEGLKIFFSLRVVHDIIFLFVKDKVRKGYTRADGPNDIRGQTTSLVLHHAIRMRCPCLPIETLCVVDDDRRSQRRIRYARENLSLLVEENKLFGVCTLHLFVGSFVTNDVM